MLLAARYLRPQRSRVFIMKSFFVNIYRDCINANTNLPSESELAGRDLILPNEQKFLFCLAALAGLIISHDNRALQKE